MSRRRKLRAMQRWNRYADRCERLALANGWGTSPTSKWGTGRGWGRGNAYMAAYRKMWRASVAAAYTHDHLEHRAQHRRLARWDWAGVRCDWCGRLLVPHFLSMPPRHDEPGTPRRP